MAAMKKPLQTAKRTAILDTATDMFLKHGFDGTSMDKLAEAVPVSKPTLYTHFKDKNDLFVAVITGRCDSFIESMYNATPTFKTVADVRKVLISIALSYLKLIRQQESIKFYRLVMAVSARFPSLGNLFYQGGPKKGLGIVSSYLKQAHDKKILAVRDPWMAANLFFAMLREDGHNRQLLGLTPDRKKGDVTQIAKYVVEVLIKSHAL